MEYKNLAELMLKKKRGRFSTVTWMKALRSLDENQKIVKISKATIRVGVKYNNIKGIQEKRDQGLLPSVSKLPWGNWKLYPFFIEHKGNEYLRVTLTKNNPINTKYYCNDVEIDKETALILCDPKEFKKRKDDPIVFTINIENIIEVV